MPSVIGSGMYLSGKKGLLPNSETRILITIYYIGSTPFATIIRGLYA